MFPSKIPLLFIAQFFAVAVLIGLALVITGNALALLGLFFFWSPPPLVPDEAAGQGGAGEQTEARTIGFVQ